jgi:hypothetical protein
VSIQLPAHEYALKLVLFAYFERLNFMLGFEGTAWCFEQRLS